LVSRKNSPGVLDWKVQCDENRLTRGETPMWTKPAYQNLRLGFEVTLYISNR